MDWFSMTKWSPYAVGVAIGILSWLTFYLSNKPIGCSTAFARTSGMIEKLFIGNKVNEKEYFKKFPAKIDWEWMFVFGIIIGSFISAQLSGTFEAVLIPQLWANSFGSSAIPRILVALFGGILMGIGSRWAGGCTSGHGISGTLQLTVSSWISVIFFFIGGIIMAQIIFNVIG
ncbi:MAG TPA: YeeE/YedE thiosulfate transporter family protein [Candidatus Mcinerneyibacterium sp.]|nr:YeeE/YedE thiosulfate transporter family protein [Candidatus Mcinerneyibacterium sp.]